MLNREGLWFTKCFKKKKTFILLLLFPGNDQTSRTLSKKAKDLTNKDKGRGTSTPQPCILQFFVWGVVNNVNQVLLGGESIPCKKLIRKDLSLLGEAGHLCMRPRRKLQQPPYHLHFFVTRQPLSMETPKSALRCVTWTERLCSCWMIEQMWKFQVLKRHLSLL